MKASSWIRYILATVVVLGVVALCYYFAEEIAPWPGKIMEDFESIPAHYVALAVLLKAGESLLTSVAWTHVLRATYPEQAISYRLVLTGYQSGVALNAVAPAKAGTFANFGILRLRIPNSRVPTLVSTFAVNSIAFTFFALINIFIVFVLFQDTVIDLVSTTLESAGNFPMLVPLAAVALILIAVLTVSPLRSRINDVIEALKAGGAILRTPREYVLKVFAPAFGSYCCRLGYSAVFMAAFDIPVTLETVFLMLGASLVSSLLAVTPGGIGVNQAVDIAIMSAYAPAHVIASASIAQDVLIKTWNVLFGLVLALSFFGWDRTRSLFDRRATLGKGQGDESSAAAAANSPPNTVEP